MSGIAFQKDKLKTGLDTQSLPTKLVLQKIAKRVAGLLIIFSIQMLLSRLMGVRHFGHFAVITTVIGLLVVISTFGFDSAAGFFLTQYAGAEKSGLQKGFIRYSNRCLALTSVICAVGVFFFLLAFSKKFNIAFAEAFFWAILMLPFLTLLKQANFFVRKLKGNKTVVPITVTLPFITLLGSLYYYYENQKLTVDAVLMIAFLTTVLLYLIFRSKLNKIRVENESEAHYSRTKWTATSGIYFMTDLVNFLIANSGILLLSYFIDNTNAGYFFVTLKLTGFVSIAGSIVTMISVPLLLDLAIKKRKKQILEHLRNGVFRILSIALPAAFILLVIGKQILLLFGDKFAGEKWLLIILIVAQLLNSLSWLNGKALVVTGNKNTYLFILIGTLAALLISGFFLVPAYKLLGAGFAVLASALFYYVSSTVMVKKLVY